ncbi:MAG: type II toxin-antitoxin system RelE/ParE family toxin [Alphaproteobacteria bacterium]|nr:type II toxin-antitoxin system RelE/ParE family toxin [Alphaproteobacteria bacterium]
MRSFKYARRARNDVDGIIEYISKDNPLAANDFANRLVGKFYELAQSPLIGREREGFGAGVRVFPFGNYVIFYRLLKTEIVIVRVLHGARNLPTAFNSES